MAKQLSLFDTEEPSDAPVPSPTLASPPLEPGQPVQGALFDESFTASLVLPEVPLAEGCRIVETEAELRELAATLASAARFAYDTETSNLDVTSAALVGISVAHGPDQAIYVPVTHPSGRGLPIETIAALLGPVFAD